jgi:hypothetical protein
MGRAISMSEAIAIEVEVEVDVEATDADARHWLQPSGNISPRMTPTKQAIRPCLNVKTARSWRGIVAYAPRAGGAYDSHHRTAGIAGRTRRCGGGVAARGERVIGHQGDMFWRAHLKLARQMAGERS